ncbi:hypothetical protein GCM10007052_07220 [Halioglobus japonicus]|nr:hypothetical protein GCM10007052_07220 [Halioglobus japonicus]
MFEDRFMKCIKTGALLLLVVVAPLSASEFTYICIDTATGEVNPSNTPCSASGGTGYVPPSPPSANPGVVSERVSPVAPRTPASSSPRPAPPSTPAMQTTPRQLQSPAPVVNVCDAAGCWDTRGNRYTQGAGTTYHRQDGRSCQSIGGNMHCN